MTIRSMYTQLRNLNEETSKISKIVQQERQNPKLNFPFVLSKSTSPSHNVKLIIQELTRVEPLIQNAQKRLAPFKRSATDGECKCVRGPSVRIIDNKPSVSANASASAKRAKNRGDNCPLLYEARELVEKKSDITVDSDDRMNGLRHLDEFIDTNPWETLGATPKFDKKCSCPMNKMFLKYNYGSSSNSNICKVF